MERYLEAYEESTHLWDDETRQMKVEAIYSGMVEDYVPTWERFPDQVEEMRRYRAEQEWKTSEDMRRKLRHEVNTRLRQEKKALRLQNGMMAVLTYFGPSDC